MCLLHVTSIKFIVRNTSIFYGTRHGDIISSVDFILLLLLLISLWKHLFCCANVFTVRIHAKREKPRLLFEIGSGIARRYESAGSLSSRANWVFNYSTLSNPRVIYPGRVRSALPRKKRTKWFPRAVTVFMFLTDLAIISPKDISRVLTERLALIAKKTALRIS